MHAEIYIPQPEFNHPAELAMIARLRDVGSELVQEYLAKYTEDEIAFIARDAAKRIFPEYNADRTLNNRYSDRAASSLADAARRFLLSAPPRPPRDQVIIITGAPASGKTSGSRVIRMERVEILHETIFTSLEKARGFLWEAVNARRSPTISLVYTRDPRINARRMIERARKIQRTVPLKFMAETFVGVPEIVAVLKDEFDDLLRLKVTDNSLKPEEAISHDDIVRCLSELKGYTKDGCLKEMDDELRKINRESPIPPEILYEAQLR